MQPQGKGQSSSTSQEDGAVSGTVAQTPWEKSPVTQNCPSAHSAGVLQASGTQYPIPSSQTVGLGQSDASGLQG